MRHRRHCLIVPIVPSLFFCIQIHFSVFRNVKYVTSFTSVLFVRSSKRYCAFQSLTLARRKRGKAEGESGVGFFVTH